MRYVVVTGRVLKEEPRYCCFCLGKIEDGYVRDTTTRLIYDEPECFELHERQSERSIEYARRKA